MGQMVQRAQKRQGKEGNRWVNQRPSGEDISKWFKENVPIADGLDHANYVAGVTLIPANEKTKEVTGWDQGNSPVLQDVWDLVYTPYIRVETRVKYFHDLMAEEKTVGIIEPVATEEQDPRLPRGFFKLVIGAGDGKEVRYIGCTMKVTVFKAGSLKEEKVLVDSRKGIYETRRVGKIVREFTPATKIVPVLSYEKPDPFALMKAETGAAGRALGMAGMLVIPGTGLATAEDLQEAGDLARGVSTSDAAEVPGEEIEPAIQAEVEGTDEELRKQVTGYVEEMGEFPQVLVEFKAWAKERGYARLSEVTSPALRGVVRRAQNMLADARNAAVEAAPEATSPPEAEPTVKEGTPDPLAE